MQDTLLRRGGLDSRVCRDLASHADVLRGSSRVPTPLGTRDEPLKTSEWEARGDWESANMKIKREETGESFASSTISGLELAPAEAPTGCLSKNSALSARGTKKEASAAEGRGCKIFQDPKYGSCIFLLLRRLLYLSVIFECVVNLQSGLFVRLSK